MYIDIHTHAPAAHAHLRYIKVESLYELTRTPFDPNLYYSLGIHPWYPKKLNIADLEHSIKLYPNIIAIGECGLDKITDTPWEAQLSIFKLQIELAQQLKKPLIIHCVRAYNECIQLLKSSQVPVVYHGFNRNQHIATSIIESGAYLSFGAALFKEALHPIFKNIPLDRVFLETDDASISIEEIYKKAAIIRDIPLEELILQLENNFKHVFLYAR